MDDEIRTFNAYAKINLSLEILGKRPDGFHEIASIMQTVGLYDVLHISPADDLQFDCNLPDLVTEDNLVWKAALLLLDRCEDHKKRGANIYLEKHIPAAAGLGGGSSDAAATLLALDELWNLDIPGEELLRLGAELGSDVPFFIRGGTTLVEGRGERLSELPPLQRSWLVLLCPPVELPANKTKELYKMLGRNDFSDGSVTRVLSNTIRRHERPPQSLLHNTFERVVYERFNQLDRYRQAMVDVGVDHVRVSGSGPTIYTMLDDQAEAQAIAERLAQTGLLVYMVPTVHP